MGCMSLYNIELDVYSNSIRMTYNGRKFLIGVDALFDVGR